MECNDQQYNYNGICESCDENCEGCTGSGPTKCIACKNVRDGQKCVEECPIQKYDNHGNCVACDFDCNGCTWHGANNCIECKKFKLGNK